ncbi:hypothetical protein ACFWPH_28680 [Nocardia sp. NPDC058499]|uniref:hypothetical protein n=1 Tax=Nocardia sp. NPDC058499 TaxID=3346530 RepID=UPI00364D7C2A
MTTELPTQQEIILNALGSLDASRIKASDARDWLNSDWQGVGTVALPDIVVEQWRIARSEIADAKAAIDQAKGALHRALDHYRDENGELP